MNREIWAPILPVIQAFVEGKQVQQKGYDNRWHDTDTMYAVLGREYRIKPESKPDVVIYLGQELSGIWFESNARIGRSILAITRCGETGALKAAEVLN